MLKEHIFLLPYFVEKKRFIWLAEISFIFFEIRHFYFFILSEYLISLKFRSILQSKGEVKISPNLHT